MTVRVEDLRPGDLCLLRTSGRAAAVIRWVTDSDVNHAVGHVGGGDIIEAEPGGSVIRPVPQAYLRAGQWYRPVGLTAEQEIALRVTAPALEHVPYSWVDDAAIGVARLLGDDVVRYLQPVRGRLYASEHMECSQVCDEWLRRCGVHLFADHRLPGNVAPGDLKRTDWPMVRLPG